MRIHAAIASLILLAGCATGRDQLIVPVDVAAAAGAPAGASRAAMKVEVADTRDVIRMERTAAAAVSMGRIVLRPPEADLVRTLVSARLQAALAKGAAVPDEVACEIRRFDVVTLATALYWDVTTSVELVVRGPSAERTAAGSATERTYSWPSAELIGRVTEGALRQTAAELDRALPGLLSGGR